MADAPQLEIIDSFLSGQAELFAHLVQTVSWDDRMAARRTASFGRAYDYSQMTYPEIALPTELIDVAERLERRLRIRFNNCLLNYYETGDNTMGFHADETAGLMPGTGVAIVSLGSVREITFRRTSNPTVRVSFPLAPGSLLYMDSAVQDHWQHAIKKQKHAGARISITWRAIA